MKKHYLLLAPLASLLLAVAPYIALAQTGGVGIGTTTPAASAALDITSTSKGLLLPRLSPAQRDAIASPATGLTIYNTTTNRLNTWNGTSWTEALGAEEPRVAVTFGYTGAARTYIVPVGVSKVRVTASGAGGGSGGGVNVGGGGATVTADVPVTPGEVLTVYVGQRGTDATYSVGVSGGYNGGGAVPGRYGASGGGATDLRRSAVAPSTNLADRIVVAGGGGGGSYNGGGGAGNPGQAGTDGAGGGVLGGGGGTAAAGGTGGAGPRAGQPGSLGLGGTGGGENGSNSGGGGGGGYYGGGGGGSGPSALDRGAGGGGSSYAVGTAANIAYTTGGTAGDGSLTIQPVASTPAPALDGSNFVNVPGTWQVSGADVYRSSGSVGIGTASPTQRLDVDGTLRLRGLSGSGNRLPTVLPDGTLGVGTPVYGAPTSAVTAAGSTATGPFPTGVAVSGTKAYVVSYNSSLLEVFDVSSPASPVLRGSVGLGLQQPTGVAVSGTIAYVISTRSNTLQTFDVSNPASPTRLGSVSTGSFPSSMAVSGTTVYVVNRGGSSHSLQVFDASNPASPTLRGTASTDSPFGVAVSGTTVYVASAGSLSLQVFDASNPASPTLRGSVGTYGAPVSVAVSGTTAYVANASTDVLQAFNVSNPASPTALGRINLGGSSSGQYTYALAVSGSAVYASNYGVRTLKVFDMSNPASPTLVSSAGTGNGPVSLAVSGNTAYVVNNNDNTLQAFASPVRTVVVGGDGTLTSVPAASGTDFIQNQTTTQKGNFNISGTGIVGGRVGIGTASPGHPLTVQADNDSRLLGFNDNNGNDNFNLSLTSGTGGGLNLSESNVAAGRLFVQAGTGNVGLGTTSPSQKLDVLDGSINIATAGQGLYFPDGTFQTTAAAGDDLGNHVATQGLTGTNGQDIGAAVGLGIRPDGGLNLAQSALGHSLLLGYQAGQALAPDEAAGTGLYNQFVGYQSGAATTTGTANVFGGYQSGFSNTTGGGNQFVGYQAGYSNTTGEANVFNGFSSGYSNTSGHSNVFAGTRSGYSNTEGNNNQFVGDNAGAGNLTGSNNSFGGYGSGLTNTTGSNNLFAGYLSGSLNTTGANNTVLGANSGPDLSHPDLTNATALGANVTLAQSNTVVLGNGASVGIGTSTPSQKLEVAGTIYSSAGGFRFPDGTTQTTAATAPNLTGDITSVGVATTYAKVVPATKGGAGAVSGILRADGSGTVTAAVPADFPTLNQSTTGNAATATFATKAGSATTVITNANLSGDITSVGNTTSYSAVVPATKGGAGSVSGLLKADGNGNVAAAVVADFPTLNQNTTGNAATATLASTATTVTTNANLTGAITSVGNTTSYNAVVPANKGGAGNVNGILKANGGVVTAATAADFPTLNQSTTGNAATVTTNANLSGDITSVGNTASYSAVVPATKGGAGTVGGILKANGAGVVAAATAADFPTLNQNTTGNAATATLASTVTTNANLAGAITSNGNTTSYNTVVPAGKGGAGTVSGILKADGNGNVSQAVAGTDYAAVAGSASYVQNGTNPQGASFNVSGTGTVGGNSTVGGNAYVNGSLGVVLNSQDRPLVTRGYNPFTSGSYQGAGRWGMFMEPSRLTFGIPAVADRHFQWVKYNENSTVAGTLMFLSQDGSLGIGTSSPQGGLHITTGSGGPGTGAGTAGALLSGAPNVPPYLELRGSGTGTNTTTPYLDFAETNDQDYTTRLISQGGILNVSGNGAGGLLLQVNGGLRANNVTYTSDARFKQNVRPLASALASVLALRGVRYEWNALGIRHGGTAGASQVGVIAQEVEKIYPELVSTDQDGYKAVNYAQLTPVLIEALKEQQAQIEALRAQAATAKAELQTVKAQAAADKAQATATLETFEARLRRLEAGTAQAQR